MHRVALTVALCVVVGACHSVTSPSQPNQNPGLPVTRIIQLEGDLTFGDIPLNSSPIRTIRIVNRGTSAIRVTGFTTPRGSGVCQEPGDPEFCAIVANWTAGEVAGSHWQDVTVRLDLRMIETWNGTFTVNSNATGPNTLLLTARGVPPE